MRRRKGRGEVTKISDLFAVYKNRLRAPQASVVKEFCEVVEDVIGIELAAENVSYQPATRTISLGQKGAVKSEILLNKEELLAHLKGRLGEQSAPTTIV